MAQVKYHKCPTCNANEVVITGITDDECYEQYKKGGPCRTPKGKIRASVHDTRKFSVSM